MQPVAPRTVSCPKCGGPVIWREESRYRPFCSARCKGIDLGAWASGDYAIPVVGNADDTDSVGDAESAS